MNVYSLMTKLLRPTNEGSAAFEDRPPMLQPRTAAPAAELKPSGLSHAVLTAIRRKLKSPESEQGELVMVIHAAAVGTKGT